MVKYGHCSTSTWLIKIDPTKARIQTASPMGYECLLNAPYPVLSVFQDGILTRACEILERLVNISNDDFLKYWKRIHWISVWLVKEFIEHTYKFEKNDEDFTSVQGVNSKYLGMFRGAPKSQTHIPHDAPIDFITYSLIDVKLPVLLWLHALIFHQITIA